MRKILISKTYCCERLCWKIQKKLWESLYMLDMILKLCRIMDIPKIKLVISNAKLILSKEFSLGYWYYCQLHAQLDLLSIILALIIVKIWNIFHLKSTTLISKVYFQWFSCVNLLLKFPLTDISHSDIT